MLEDDSASSVEHIRKTDESGEDYLYPASCFIDAHLPEAVEEAVDNAG